MEHDGATDDFLLLDFLMGSSLADLAIGYDTSAARVEGRIRAALLQHGYVGLPSNGGRNGLEQRQKPP